MIDENIPDPVREKQIGASSPSGDGRTSDYSGKNL